MDTAGRTSGIILAGGRSTRLGRDKASEPLAGRPLLQHVIDRVAPLTDDVVIAVAPGQRPPPLTTDALVVACDMPLLSAPLLRHMIELAPEADIVLPLLERPEPLHAVYSRVCLEPIQERIEAGELKVAALLEAVRVRYVPEEECRRFDPELRSFMNANTDADLARIRAIVARGG